MRKAAVLAAFAAIRAAMRGCNELQVELEKLALRLDLLSNVSDVVSFDPDVARSLAALDENCVKGFEWVVDEMCMLLRCMGMECKAKHFEREDEAPNGG